MDSIRDTRTDTIIIMCRARHLSYQRGKRNTNPSTSLVKIEGVEDPKAASYASNSPSTCFFD